MGIVRLAFAKKRKQALVIKNHISYYKEAHHGTISNFFQTTFMDILDEMDECSWLFSKNPQSGFSRKSKLGFKKTLSIILSLGSKSIPNELLDYFLCAQDIPSSSAFVQSRNKLLPETLEFLFHEFNSRCNPCSTYKGFRLLAIDGSELQMPTNPEDKDSYFPNAESKKSYNLLH